MHLGKQIFCHCLQYKLKMWGKQMTFLVLGNIVLNKEWGTGKNNLGYVEDFLKTYQKQKY